MNPTDSINVELPIDQPITSVPADRRYDVIIIGGRPAGSTLAARLGRAGTRVLLLDRARFPSLPPVSSPVIYASTMSMLDEIGLDERDYARGTPRIRRIVTESSDHFRGVGKVPDHRGRDYAYAVDRARFDGILWEHAAHTPNVTAYDEFSAVDLIWSGTGADRRVIGIIGKPNGGEPQAYLADVVVGADGRSSLVARKVGAAMYNVKDEKPVTYYYAYWRGVAPYDLDEPLLLTHGNLQGFGYLMMDSADGTTAVTVGGYTPTWEQIDHTDATDLYLKALERAPRFADRLRNAEMVGTVRGLKNVPNYYRQAYGAGWALVGDAVHHKDPLGGQGIYDAVYSAREFAENYLAYRGGEPWALAMERYKLNHEQETLAMYQNTVAATDNFGVMNPLMQMLGRYAVENPAFIDRMVSVPARAIAPEKVANPGLIAGTLARGVVRDVWRLVTGAPSPAAVPPLPGQAAPTASSAARLGCAGWLLLLPLLILLNGRRK
jgi:flavin-dependent dehydrogenase